MEASESGQNRSGLAAGVEPEVDRAASRIAPRFFEVAVRPVGCVHRLSSGLRAAGVRGEVTATGLNMIC